MKRKALTAIGCAIAIAPACAPDPWGTPIDTVTVDPTNVAPEAGTCSDGPPPVPVDPSTLPSCCTDAPAHCETRSNVDPAFAAQLTECPTGVCVPDPFLRDPSFAPKPCTSLNAAPGVCLSVCIPQVGNYVKYLPADVCADGERCAPCISPIGSKSTGACDLGKPKAPVSCGSATDAAPASDAGAPACPYSGPPVVDPKTLPSCGPAPGAHCISTVSASESALLTPCPGGAGFCVPDTFIESGGNFIPPSCRAAGDVEGRCLHRAIPAVEKQLDSLVQSTCGLYERCVPCFDPLTGDDTGSCRLSCDPGPAEPVTRYPSCCTKGTGGAPLGTCIPSVLVPAAQQSNLNADTCAAGQSLCVPNEQLHPPASATACTATPLVGKAYAGVCLSACLKFDFLQSLGIAQGTCDSQHLCAPCINPITNQPTGAPGCPP